MFNIGSGEIALIAVVALLILGPTRLPELARGIGKFMREFRRQTDEVRGVVEREFYRMDTELQKDPTETLQVRPAKDLVAKNPYPTPSEAEALGGDGVGGETALGGDGVGGESALGGETALAGEALAAPPEHVASQLTAGMPPDTGAPPAEPPAPAPPAPAPAEPTPSAAPSTEGPPPEAPATKS